eukprot:TRINITY_DN15873_c0_g1_i1.p1 TRINITY_DN15873_c0_g1~~TRINITY_DN15873_c0_g1_i1.p1  ORF type:complete len:430 (-),score=82.61 TRINITY_DN15873_c0_g1_i1:82-1371(-)
MACDVLFIVHGYRGDPENFRVLCPQLLDACGSRVHIHCCEANFEKTDDGVDVCGDRIAKEVHAHIVGLREKNVEMNSISFWGHSMGGLFIRYALKQLTELSLGLICGLTPRFYFTTVCPHLGVSTPFIHDMVGRLPEAVQLSRSLTQVLLKDDDALVLDLSTEGAFLEPLRLFPFRAAVANLYNDVLVDFCTSSLQSRRPEDELIATPIGGDFPHVICDTTSWTDTSITVDEVLGSAELRTTPTFYDGLALEKELERGLASLRSMPWRIVCVRFDDGYVYNDAHSEVLTAADSLRYIFEVVMKDPLADRRISRRQRINSRHRFSTTAMAPTSALAYLRNFISIDESVGGAVATATGASDAAAPQTLAELRKLQDEQPGKKLRSAMTVRVDAQTFAERIRVAAEAKTEGTDAVSELPIASTDDLIAQQCR